MQQPPIDVLFNTSPCMSPFVNHEATAPPTEDNLACDVCGYIHPKPNPQVVVMGADGVIRCARCRAKIILSEKEEWEMDDED